MKSSEVEEQFNLTPEIDPIILEKTTPEFWTFWKKQFGTPDETLSNAEYWEKCQFVFVGWLAATQNTKDLSRNYLELAKEFKNEVDVGEAEIILNQFVQYLYE